MIRRFNTIKTILKFISKGNAPKGWRQFTAAISMIILGLLVSACSESKSKLPEGAMGYVGGFLGGVVADEPRAALVGRDILSRGGSAADAASAMYFMLSVTLPSRAGLGGGGTCVVFDVKSGKSKALDFTAPAPASISPNSDRPTAIPGNPRGFFALQARYGNLFWREVVAPAEQLARRGYPISRALAKDLQAIGPTLLMDPAARIMFGDASGTRLIREGETVEPFDLAATLGSIRAGGIGAFYGGVFARHFIDAVNRAGGSLTASELREFLPKWKDTVRVNIGNEVAHFAPLPAAASTVAAEMLAMLVNDDNYGGADVGVRAHLIAETGLRAFADRATWLNAQGQSSIKPNTIVSDARIERLTKGLRTDQRTPVSAFSPRPQNRSESPSATGFSAVDPLGNAVSCMVTMNSAFGTGRVAQGTGILLASAPSSQGRGPLGLASVLVVNENSKEFRFAATASGGVAAPSALIGVLANTMLDEQDLKTAEAQPRTHLSGNPDMTFYEPGLTPKALAFLSKAKHQTQPTPMIGLVNALYCPDGLPATPATCQMVADPRWVGLAAGSMR